MAEAGSFDLVMIGGGPAGYVGAIRAAQLGMKVACVEHDKLGGVCLNWGCIPTKALLAEAEFYHRLRHDAGNWGIQAGEVRHDWSKVIGRSRRIAGGLNKGVQGLFKKNKVTHVQGSARVVAAGKVEVYKPAEGSESSWDPGLAAKAAKPGELLQTLNCKHIVIATGAIARSLPGAEFDGDKIIGSKEAMALPEQPKSLLIIGGGAIGMEFGYFYNAFGTKVTVVEMMDRLLPAEDADVSAAIEKSFRKQGVEVRTAHKTTKVEKTAEGVKVTIAPVPPTGPGAVPPTAQERKPDEPVAAPREPDTSKAETLTADKVLVAIGVKGRIEGLFGDKIRGQIELYKDHIKADRRTYATSVPGVFAVGDVNGPPWLAHVASEEAIICVERIAGHHPPDIDYDTIPGCTYCQPQVASVGHTEARCQQLGLKYRVGKFPFLASGKAQAAGHTEGFVKIIADEKHGEILGVHMIGDGVTEMIHELALAKRAELTVDEVINTVHAHPTLSEAMHEAALGVEGRMIHF